MLPVHLKIQTELFLSLLISYPMCVSGSEGNFTQIKINDEDNDTDGSWKYPPRHSCVPWTFSLYQSSHHSHRGDLCYFASVACLFASALLLLCPELSCLSCTLHWRLSTQSEHRIRRGDTQPSTHQYLWCRTPCNTKKKNPDCCLGQKGDARLSFERIAFGNLEINLLCFFLQFSQKNL